MLLIDLSKGVISGNDVSKEVNKTAINRIVSAVLIFAVPYIVKLVAGELNMGGYLECINNANPDTISKYEKIEEEERQNEEAERAAKIKAKEAINNKKKDDTSSGTKSDGEPNPLEPLKLLYKQSATTYSSCNPDNYISKTDSSGNCLGAWPKNADTSNLPSNKKTYQNGNLIYPVTGDGWSCYSKGHSGIDITAPTGSKVYSPVDGTVSFSTWGRTANKGKNETAYSVYILVDKPFEVKGNWNKGGNTSKKVYRVFLTHMSGLARRGGDYKVKKGDFIGFSGVANNSPHLHMTLYADKEGDFVSTDTIKSIYGLSSSKKTREAGN